MNQETVPKPEGREQPERCFLCGRERDPSQLLHCEGREPYICADKWDCQQACVDARRVAESQLQAVTDYAEERAQKCERWLRDPKQNDQRRAELQAAINAYRDVRDRARQALPTPEGE